MIAYIILALQILIAEFIFFGRFIFNLTLPSMGLLFILFIISALVFIFLYIIKPKAIWISILTFIPNIYLANKYYFLNFLPFIALYFSILNILKERNVSFKYRNIILFPIFLLGFLRINVKGFFENTILALLFTPGKISQNPSSPFEGQSPISNLVNFIREISSRKTVSLRFWNSMEFLNIIFVITTVAFIILIYYFFKIVSTADSMIFLKKRKRNYINLVINLLIFIFLAILIYGIPADFSKIIPNSGLTQAQILKLLIFIVVFSTVILLIVAKVAKKSEAGKKEIRTSFPSMWQQYFFVLTLLVFGFTLILLKRLQIIESKKFSDFIDIVGLFLALSSIVSIFILVFSVKRSINIATLKNLFGEKYVNFIEIAEEGDLEEALSKIKNKRDYVLLFYFILIYNLIKKGIGINVSETPNEYFKRLISYGIVIPNFNSITNIFNKARYSEEDIEDYEFEQLKECKSVVIDFIKSLN